MEGEAASSASEDEAPVIELDGAQEENYHKHTDDSSAEDSGNDEDEENDDQDLGEINRYWPPPVSENFEIQANFTSKTVAALAFNNAGTRFAAGGHDYELHIWDFEALDPTRPMSICDAQPCGQTVIKNLDYSPDDELILVISGGCQAIIVAKDGLVAKQYQCAKGDQYISDMSNTKGHVQMLNDGCWNPKDKQNFITCSNDGTVRIWDMNKLSQQKTVIKTRSPASGIKAVPNVCKFSRDCLSIVTGCNDGSVLMWDTRRKFISTSATIKNAHLKGSEITGLDFSYGSTKLCTRSEDESCKIWDLRKLKEPLASRTGLSSSYSTTDCSFSPDDKFVITGTSRSKQEQAGQLHFLAVEEQLLTKQALEVEAASVIRSKWHPKINHIVYSCSDGRVRVAYDRRRSMGGCLAFESSGGRGLKRKKYVSERERAAALDPTSIKRIITPHALPLFRDDSATVGGSSSSFAKIRQDPRRSYKPEMPIAGVSQGGRVKPAGSTLSSYIARNIAKPVDDGGLDIRERILRHADEAARDPRWIRPVGGDQNSGGGGGRGSSNSGSSVGGVGADGDVEKNRAKPSMQQPQLTSGSVSGGGSDGALESSSSGGGATKTTQQQQQQRNERQRGEN